MAGVLTPSLEELKAKRKNLVAESKMSERELRLRAANYQLGPRESDLLREIDEIDYLLGK